MAFGSRGEWVLTEAGQGSLGKDLKDTGRSGAAISYTDIDGAPTVCSQHWRCSAGADKVGFPLTLLGPSF